MSTKPLSVYLDYAAATPLDERVLAVMRPYFSDRFYNPSANYRAARETSQALETARAKVAHWLGARGSEVVFTAGGTEANNLAVHGVMRRFPAGNIVVSAIEHESVLAPAKHYDCREARVQPDGRLDLDYLAGKIDSDTILVSVGYVNNEIGTVQPLRDIARLIDELRRQRLKTGNRRPLYLHTDACQAANYFDLHAARLGVDLMSLNGGKIYGPKQSGALYVKAGTLLEPIIEGGGQERGLRSGTENVAGAIGFGEALEISQTIRREEAARLKDLQEQFVGELRTVFPAATCNGSMKHRAPNNIHVTLPGNDNERLLIQLDEAGVMAAAGSACSASSQEYSHVLRAIGLDDAAARASLRFTTGRQTTHETITQTIALLERLAAPTKRHQ